MYTFQSRVRYSETDSEERLTLSGIIEYFQDCGTFDSEELGLGVKYLAGKRLAWLLTSWQIIVEEYPCLGDEIVVGNFPYDFKGFVGYRNYTMDREGRRVAYANAIWVLTDIEKMKPAMPTREMYEKYKLEKRLDMEYAPRHIREAENGSWEEGFPVKNYHLDSNHHVNNVQYIKMAEGYLPKGADVWQLRAEYKNQAYLGDMILPHVQKEEGRSVIALCNEMKKPYAVIEFTERKNKGKVKTC